MKKISVFLFLTISFFLITHSKEKIKVVSAFFEPFVFEKNGEIIGFDIDLLRQFSLENDYEIEIQIVDFKDIWEKLDKEEADIACGALYFTEDRARKYLASDGYFKTGLVIVSPYEKPINTVLQLKNKNVGVKIGATGENFAKSLNMDGFPINIFPFKSTEESFEALKRREIDCLLNDFISSKLLIQKKYIGEFVISQYQNEPSFLEKNDLVFYFIKQKPYLHKRFNTFLENLKQKGTLQNLSLKWIPEITYSKKGLLLSIITLSLVLIIFIFFVTLFQQKRIKKRAYYLSEKKYKELLYEAPIPIIIHKEGKLIFANKKVFEDFGYDENVVKEGYDILNFVAENEREKIKNYIKLRTEGKEVPINYETWILKADGTTIPVEVNVKLITLGGQKLILLFLNDLTEKKRIFEELKKSEEKYRKIFENVSEGIFISTVDGKPILANPALIKMLGYENLEECLKRDIENEGYLNPEDRKKFKELIERDGKVENFETKWLKKDGTPIWVIESAFPLYDEKGEIFAYEGTVRDITERKKAEELLRESEEYYRTLFENAHDAIMVFEPEKEIILDCNEMCAKLYGYKKEELIGTSLESLTKYVEKGKERIEELLKKGVLKNFETTHFKKDRTEMILEVNASLIKYRGKVAILSINRDITEKKKSEKLILERQKQLLALLESAEAMGTYTDLKASANSICLSIINSFNLDMAWIGLVVPESTELKVIASAGNDNGYTEKVKVRWDESERAQGPTGRCIVTRKTTIMRVSDPKFSPWREEAEKRGFKVVCAIPLISGDHVRGALTLYSADENFFTPYQLETLEIFARHATMAIVTASLYEEANRTIQELLSLQTR